MISAAAALYSGTSLWFRCSTDGQQSTMQRVVVRDGAYRAVVIGAQAALCVWDRGAERGGRRPTGGPRGTFGTGVELIQKRRGLPFTARSVAVMLARFRRYCATDCRSPSCARSCRPVRTLRYISSHAYYIGDGWHSDDGLHSDALDTVAGRAPKSAMTTPSRLARRSARQIEKAPPSY